MESIKLTNGTLELTENVIARLAALGYTPESLQEDINYYAPDGDAPNIYVGTFGKYAAGNLSGQRVDVSNITDASAFDSFLRALHADEEDPELMVQDAENIPFDLIGESYDETDVELLQEYCSLCDRYGAEPVDDYFDLYFTFNGFEDAYMGEWENEEDFAHHIVEECYPEVLNGPLGNYFDYDSFARDLFLEDYTMSENGHVFNR
jgi:antirestriction protein